MAQQDAITGEPLKIVILSGVEGPLQCRRRLCCRSGFSRRRERRKTITACSEDDAAGNTSGGNSLFRSEGRQMVLGLQLPRTIRFANRPAALRMTPLRAVRGLCGSFGPHVRRLAA